MGAIRTYGPPQISVNQKLAVHRGIKSVLISFPCFENTVLFLPVKISITNQTAIFIPKKRFTIVAHLSSGKQCVKRADVPDIEEVFAPGREMFRSQCINKAWIYRKNGGTRLAPVSRRETGSS